MEKKNTVISDLLNQKKFVVALVALLVQFLAQLAEQFGFEVDQTQLTMAMGSLYAYIIAQGIADHGKSAQQIGTEAYVKEQATTRNQASGEINGSK